jgi:hypothetical protein
MMTLTPLLTLVAARVSKDLLIRAKHLLRSARGAMRRPPRGDALNAVDAPDRARLRDRQGPAGLHSLHWRVVGRIYQTRGGPDNLRWFWSLTVNGSMTRADRVATLEEAKAQFQKSWDAWKAWAKLEEVE